MLNITPTIAFITLISFSSGISACTPSNNDTKSTIGCFSNTSGNKLDSNKKCTKVTLGAGDFNVTSNGKLFIKKYNLTLNETSYILGNDTATICQPHQKSVGMSCLNVAGYFIAFICLFTQFECVWIVDDMKQYVTLGIYTFGLITCYAIISSIAIHIGFIVQYQHLPYTVSALIHFCMLSSVSWMSMMTTDAVLDLKRKFTIVDCTWYYRAFVCTVTFVSAVGIVFLIYIAFSLAATSVFNELVDIPHRFLDQSDDKYCWIVDNSSCMSFFVGHVAAIIGMNFAFHYFSNCVYKTTTRDYEIMKITKDERNDHIMVCAFSIIIYITYIIGALAAIPAISWMWYIFIFLNIVEIFCIVFSTSMLIRYVFSFRPAHTHVLCPAYSILRNSPVVCKIFSERDSRKLKDLQGEIIEVPSVNDIEKQQEP